jgi:glycine/D-amino acid oxidase-like deaminating enzyme
MSNFVWEHLAGKRVAVLGAGMVGLATANRLLELAESSGQTLQVDVITEKLLRETTSDGAGGLFEPDDENIHGVSDQLKRQWIQDSFQYYDRMLNSPEGGKMGFFHFSGYLLFEHESRDKVT